MNKLLKILGPILMLLFIVSCGGRDFVKSPVDEYITQFVDEQNFAIILEDMDVEGTFFKTYKHRYQVILEDSDGKPLDTKSEWKEVGEKFFWHNEGNLGMTLCYRKDGKLEKNVSPPGYQYVGNSKYGEFRTNNGTSFWAFYGQYMFMSHMFGMMNRPIYRNDYNTYRSGYYGSKGYYGPKTGGNHKYGTNSAGTRKSRPGFFNRRANRTGWGSSRGRSGFGGRGSGFGK
ncbi:MAG: hypothetical protein COC01_01000 [Bacteroidetes bacterium]|nr:hypothetical protein [Bacteroidia bacterium]PCH69696.1 MAG: hypothetical protein COC01_01000 [Bacteroidota bacterium]